MASRTFLVYSDPGHSWAKVPKAFLVRIIGPHWRSVFTPFSYERGEFVYLEEDDDAGRFVNWCRANGIEPVFKSGSCSNRYSRIRNYAPLAPMEL
jgi:hypothetical protein